MSLPLRGSVMASVRSFLLSDSVLVELLKHSTEVNKIVIDSLDYDAEQPFIVLSVIRGGRINNDPFPDFDMWVTVKVMGEDLRELYTIYGRVEELLSDVMLPEGFQNKYYAPVRATDATYFEMFKVAQTDLYRIGGTFRVRGVKS